MLADLLYRLGATGALDRDEWAELAAYPVDDVDTGLALQLDVLRRWTDTGSRRGGWKIGLTSRSARDSMGVGVRPFGYVLADRIVPSGATVSLPAGAKAEPEISVLLGADLRGPDVTPEQARAAVVSVAPALELLSPPLPAGTSRAVRLGHDLNQWGVVVGADVTPDVDLAAVRVTVGDESAASGPDVLDDPFVSLARVCAHLAAHGEFLHAGDRVITGSLLPAIPVPPVLRAEFAPLGAVEVRTG
jgi:2-keto-4-pentenoate hydratase